jgi:hypothetical protein
MLPVKETLQVAGVMLNNGKTVGVQVEITRRQFTFEFYFTFPLAFVFGKLKSRWVPLSERFKGYSGKKQCYQTNSAQCLSVFNLL